MVWICLRWFMPLELARAGWDTKVFQAATFNFIYAEPTNTLGIPKVWVWVIVPVFTAGAFVHSLANLVSPQASEPPQAFAR